MSAREEILELLWWAVPSTDSADAKRKAAQMLDAYAHELAEIQRVQASEYEATQTEDFVAGMQVGADLIDPEVER